MILFPFYRYDGWRMDDQNDASLLLKIEEMIKTHLSQIDDLSGEITKHKEVFDNFFGQDETYRKHDEEAKAAAKIRSKTKSEIMKKPAVAELSGKLKDLKLQKKELQEGLSDYLKEYQRLSGSSEIEGDDGEVREIVFVARLVKKSAYRP